MRRAEHVQRIGEDRLSKRAWKAEEGGNGKTVSNEILKGQVRAAKSGRPSQKTEGDGEH